MDDYQYRSNWVGSVIDAVFRPAELLLRKDVISLIREATLGHVQGDIDTEVRLSQGSYIFTESGELFYSQNSHKFPPFPPHLCERSSRMVEYYVNMYIDKSNLGKHLNHIYTVSRCHNLQEIRDCTPDPLAQVTPLLAQTPRVRAFDDVSWLDRFQPYLVLHLLC